MIVWLWRRKVSQGGRLQNYLLSKGVVELLAILLWDHKLKEGFKLKVSLILLLQLLLTARPPLTLHTPQSQPTITEFYLFETIQPLCKEEEGGGGGVEINTINS